MRVKIEVTQEDIDKGSRESETHCPVARAVKRAIPWFNVRAGNSVLYLDNKSGQPVCKVCLPFRAQDFIERFDNRVEVRPETFFVTGVPPR